MDMTYPDDASQQQAMLIDEQEWLEELARDEAARREFHDRLASPYSTRTGHDHATDKRNDGIEVPEKGGL
jgi:hypothetical protein